MANPSVSIDIENPSTVYTLPPPPKYSEIYKTSNTAPQLPLPNLPPENRNSVLLGPSEARPNLARSAATTTRNTPDYYESNATRRRFHDAVIVRCCFTLPFLIAFIVFAIIKIVNS